MNASLKYRGQTRPELREMFWLRPTASKVTRGFPLMIVRSLRATQPDRPWPTFNVVFSSFGASTPTAKRHFSESVSGWWRKSEQPDHDSIFESFVEISAIVSETPRLVPIDCAIS